MTSPTTQTITPARLNEMIAETVEERPEAPPKKLEWDEDSSSLASVFTDLSPGNCWHYDWTEKRWVAFNGFCGDVGAIWRRIHESKMEVTQYSDSWGAQIEAWPHHSLKPLMHPERWPKEGRITDFAKVAPALAAAYYFAVTGIRVDVVPEGDERGEGKENGN